MVSAVGVEDVHCVQSEPGIYAGRINSELLGIHIRRYGLQSSMYGTVWSSSCQLKDSRGTVEEWIETQLRRMYLEDTSDYGAPKSTKSHRWTFRVNKKQRPKNRRLVVKSFLRLDLHCNRRSACFTANMPRVRRSSGERCGT